MSNAIALPTGYGLYGVSNDGNTVTGVREGSSASEPVFFKITRKRALWNAGQGRFSVPQIEVRLTRGLVEGNPSLPIAEQELASFTFRLPVGHEDPAKTVLDDLVDFMGQADLLSKLAGQILPNCCVEEVAP